MKIVLAADGSGYTKKALAFLVTHEQITAGDAEVIVLNVQPPMPPRVKSMVGASVIADYYEDESAEVLKPISAFLERHKVAHRCLKAVGNPGDEILRTVADEKAHMIVMGTHGHGFLGRVVMGSVAQNVVQASTVPVLLVK